MTAISRLLVLGNFAAVVVASSERILRYPIKQRKAQPHTARKHDQRERRNKGTQVIDEDFLDDMYRGQGVHYVNLFVGCPPQEQSVIVNTGSDDTGFPCVSGCDVEVCGEDFHVHGFFDEEASSCFTRPSCDDCTLTPGECDAGSEWGETCSVSASYSEGSSWDGIEVQDMVSSGGTDEDTFPFRFACEAEVTGLFRTQLSDGILGMANSDESYWKQAYDAGLIDKKQFSLCHILNREVQEEAGVMVLGGSDTRMHKGEMRYAKDIPESMFYQVRVKEIQLRLGDSNSTVPVSTSGSYSSAETKMTVVSGDTWTYLNEKLREPLKEAWGQIAEAESPFSSGMYGEVRYDEAQLKDLPTFIFVLEGTASDGDDVLVEFPPSRYLEYDGSGRYSSRVYADESGSGELGNNFLSGHDVLFDVENERIGFAKSDCVVLSDDEPAPTTTTAATTTAATTTAATTTVATAAAATITASQLDPDASVVAPACKVVCRPGQAGSNDANIEFQGRMSSCREAQTYAAMNFEEGDEECVGASADFASACCRDIPPSGNGGDEKADSDAAAADSDDGPSLGRPQTKDEEDEPVGYGAAASTGDSPYEDQGKPQKVAMLVTSVLVATIVFVTMVVVLRKFGSKKPEPDVQVVTEIVEATPVV